MSAFEIIPGHRSSSVVPHVPHSSTQIPDDVRRGIVLTDDELTAELVAITDADTDRVATRAAALASVRPWIFVNRASRLIIDPERFPDECEELKDVGMGAVFGRTTTGAVLRTPNVTERAALIDEFYKSHAEGIAALVRERLEAIGRVTILDIDFYPLVKNLYELHGDGTRPEACTGTDAFHTGAALADAATSAMANAAPTGEVGLNLPFAGCYVPLDQYEQNTAVQAVMLEVRRDVGADRRHELAAATAALIDTQEAR